MPLTPYQIAKIRQMEAPVLGYMAGDIYAPDGSANAPM